MFTTLHAHNFLDVNLFSPSNSVDFIKRMTSHRRVHGSVGVAPANRKSETPKTGILKSEPETKKCNDLIEKQICDRQTQNLINSGTAYQMP